MKKLLHFLLLGIYVFSCTELQELTKLPVLFQHYFEHQNLDKNITFLSYIEHHYNDVPHTDNDTDRDNQLPFKTHNFCASSVLSPALPSSWGISLKKVSFVLRRQKIKIDNDNIPNAAPADSIWQPPKSLILS